MRLLDPAHCRCAPAGFHLGGSVIPLAAYTMLDIYGCARCFSVGGLSSSEGEDSARRPVVQHSVPGSRFLRGRPLNRSQSVVALYLLESAVPRDLLATRGTAGAARSVGPLGERSDRPRHQPRRAGRRGMRSRLRKCKATDGRCIESEDTSRRLSGSGRFDAKRPPGVADRSENKTTSLPRAPIADCSMQPSFGPCCRSVSPQPNAPPPANGPRTLTRRSQPGCSPQDSTA